MNFKEKLTSIAYANQDRLAVVDHDNNVNYTYHDFIEFNQGLLNSNIENKKIGVFMDKSADYIAAIYAITLSSNSFIPLDPSYPAERLKFIINDSSIDYILTNEKFSQDLRLKDLNIPKIRLTRSQKMRQSEYDDDQLFYTIYTSGTTGIPKGVQLSFRGIDNVIQQQIDVLNLYQDHIYLFLSISFDASLSDIYCSLLSSSTLYINETIKKEITNFIEYINENKISYTDIPPSFIKLINPQNLPTLKAIIIGGEVADPKTVRDYIKSMKVINVYGPTEATICTSYSICDENWSIPYIGQPLNGVEYTVFDDTMNIVRDGVGELYISGIQLAIGYTNQKITQERFITLNNKLYYKSGDKVIISNKGIEFVGRIDRQIKHNGQLICLEEIEQAINSLEAIKNVSVVYKNKKLYAYYEGDIDKQSIINFIKTVLPVYMIPHFFINNLIPKTVNGKNDSSTLSKDNTVFEKISTIFRTILGIDDIDETLSFKDLGADSINIIQLQEELHKLGLKVPYNYLFDKNTIEAIVNYRSYSLLTKKDLVNAINFDQIKTPDTSLFVNTEIALVTGVTGSLGIHVLSEIQSSFKTIYCLVRARTPEQAWEKFNQNKMIYNLNFPTDNIQIIPITNLNDKWMGLSEKQYTELTSSVSHIYHNAANVNNMKSFDALYNDNVVSTLNVINFSFSGLLKAIHYASTLSVYVSGEHSKDSVFSEDVLDINDDLLFNGYAQTKWLSDYLMSYSNQYNQIKQYRLGLLVPETFTEKDKSSFLYQLIDLMSQESSLPRDNIGACFDFTPVTWAAKTMKNISMSDDPQHIYNITTNIKVYYNDLIQYLNVQPTLKDDWFHNRSDYLSQLLSILNTSEHMAMNLFEMTYVNKFATNNSQPYMETNIEHSKSLKGYINYINK
jgi:amino acid adenylation domain-containing protein